MSYFRLVTSSAYQAGGQSQELAGFNPLLRSSDAEVLPSRPKIVARARDVDRNNGLIAGGIDRRVDAVVGSNIWLRCRPDFAAIGQTAEWADEWAIHVESLFRCWANSARFLCDVERQQHFGGLVRTAYYHYVREGVAAAAPYWIDDRGGIFATAILVLDPDRLSNPDGKSDGRQPDGTQLRGGLELDRRGAAVAYWIRDAHPGDVGTTMDANRWTRVPRETATGRPQFIHAVDRRRAHQRHAVGRLAAIMARVQMQGLADKTELQAQITNAIFGLYAKTKRSSDDMAQSLAPADDVEFDAETVRANFYEQSELTFDGVRVAVLPSDDEIATISSDRASTNFVAFQNYIIRAMASALGLSYEQLSNDWSGINYSSARTLLNEIWRGLIADRHLFTQAFCTPIFAAWLEEAVARDLVAIPGGKAYWPLFRDALLQCDWIGPGRGKIDPKKEAEAGAMDRAGFVSTLQDDCAEQGKDWRQVEWQARREKAELERYGLTTTRAAGGVGHNAGPAIDEDNDAQDARDKRESAGAEA